MSQALLLVLMLLILLMAFPLFILIHFLQPFLLEKGEVGSLRRIIYILAWAKIVFMSLILIADLFIYQGITPVSVSILSLLILAVLTLTIANWWALIEIRKLLI